MNKFGIIKSKLLTKLTESYANENKAEIKDILTTIKENKDFKEMYLFYEEIENKYIDDKETAKLYVEGVVNILKQQMDDLTTFINDIEYYFFENLAYNYYCILYQDFKKIIVPDIEHSLEGQPSQIVEKYIHYNIGWIALSTYKQNPDFYDKQDNIYMIYHLDR